MMPGKTLHSQEQQYVLNLLHYFEREKEHGGPLISINSVQQRVADALKISVRTVYNVKQRATLNPILSPPGKKRHHKKPKVQDLNERAKMEVRNTLYNMYKEKKHVTVRTLNNEIQNKIHDKLSDSSLNRLLLHLGFKFKKEDNQRALMEKPEIAAMRFSFLRKYKANLNSLFARQVIFLDETWIFSKGTKGKSWQNDDIKSIRKPARYDGKRFIILHAGGEHGFVNNASLIFATKSKSADYHDNMNSDLFNKWVTEKLILNLEEPSLIILDNAPYHSILVSKQPAASWNRNDILNCLNDNEIAYEHSMNKAELLVLVKNNKKEKRYAIDELLQEHGHDVLRLPPYYCEFNAIELIWAKTKQYYNHNIGRDGYGDEKVLQVWQEALNQCDTIVWQNCIWHTNKVIGEWFTREVQNAEPFIINVNNSDTDDSNDKESN